MASNLDLTRRNFFRAGAAISAGSGLSCCSIPEVDAIESDLRKYLDFGIKQAGGEGDNACGEWLEGELQAFGFEVERQTIQAPFFDARRAELVVEGASAAVWPQPIVMPTPAGGLEAELVRVDAQGNAMADLAGAIALIDLPSGKWSSMMAPALHEPIEAAFAAGAIAAVAITNGPTGKIIALNTDGAEPMFSGPTALLAPEDAAPFLAAASQQDAKAKLFLEGAGGRRPAFNLIGKLDRGKDEWLVISTPRSGWFTCGAERGGGIAAWLKIARWSAEAVSDLNIAMICNSGHEYENLGAEEAIREAAPKPEETRFWLHLGANLAARDWHTVVGGVRPLRGTDSQRYLVVTESLLETSRALFARRSGLENPYSSEDLSAGELTEIIEAGYPLVAGIFGIHRFHHIAEDGEDCIMSEETAITAQAFQALVEQAIG